MGVKNTNEAGSGDVLVTRTARDLVADSGIEFPTRGVHALKVVSDPKEPYAVAERPQTLLRPAWP